MPPLARADLESLLRARRLDRTLTTIAPAGSAGPDLVAATGDAALDARLGGGLRRGHVSELIGPRSSGRTTLLCRILAAATARDELTALIDPFDRFDPEPARATGVHLPKLLWVRGTPLPPGGAHGIDDWPLDRGLKALNLVLQAGGFGVVAFDLADAPAPAIRRVPFTTWLRLARVIEATPTVCVLIGPSHIARSPAGATIALEGRGRWGGASPRSRLYHGIDLKMKVAGW
jgi:hypothetical protein